ncbi:MAG: acetylxylan esterase [Segetibacter sp.]
MKEYFLKVRITTFSIFLLSAFITFITISGQPKPNTHTYVKDIKTDTLPNVFNENQGRLIESKLRQEAVLKFALHEVPTTKKELETLRVGLKNEIINKTGALVNQKLPLNLKETGSLKMKGYTIKNIAFQTRPGIYATANLYVPDGKGKFAAVIVMMGHSANGRFYDKYQSVGITLALNGYVSLCIDPWGAGERTTTHGVFEDHGDENNLGAAFMNIGESLMGMLITDNMRGVDLLCSLPYVNTENIGATGSSGGGNQTMWLTALDHRIKAAVPVVSAGTFEAYIMGSPCICEVLIDGLTFTEEAAVLALIAPRTIKMCNHNKDANKAFNPLEMLRS